MFKNRPFSHQSHVLFKKPPKGYAEFSYPPAVSTNWLKVDPNGNKYEPGFFTADCIVDSDGTKTEIYYDKDQEGVSISQFYSEDEVETDDISIEGMLKLIEQSRMDESKKKLIFLIKVIMNVILPMLMTLLAILLLWLYYLLVYLNK